MRCLLCLLLFATTAHAEPLEPLYGRIAEDLNAGRPLVIAGFYGLWFTRNDEPDRNLNWGVYYGHARMLARARKDTQIRTVYSYWKWRRVHASKAGADPRRTVVYHQRVKPNRAWRKAGVTKPFDAYLVMQAFSSREEAARRMARVLNWQRGRTLTLDDGSALDVGQAQVSAYFGHNLFYDYLGYQWGGLDRVGGQPERPTGFAAVGCNTNRVPGFSRLAKGNAIGVLLSRSLMASEGYSTLALADGVLRRLGSKAMVQHADRTYQHFQKLAKPNRRVGRPFVSQGYKWRDDVN